MAGVKVDVSGLPDLKASMSRVQARIAAELETALAEEAEEVAADARGNVRVDSGDLHDSITAEVNGLEATVAPRDELLEGDYVKAMVNEFGRSRDPGQPYMTPASEASRQRWPKRSAEAVKKATGG